MRTTVDLDPDLYALAKSVAATEDCSLSAAINKLLRARSFPPRTDAVTGLPVSKGNRPVTMAEVAEIIGEEG